MTQPAPTTEHALAQEARAADEAREGGGEAGGESTGTVIVDLGLVEV